MITEDLTKYNTITSLLSYETKSNVSYNKLFLKAKITNSSGEDLLINSSSFGNKYMEYIKPHLVSTTLTDVELARYKFSPKLFCYDKYGTIELWGLLLQVNHMTSCTEFNKNTIKTFTNDIFDVINEILISEEDTINKNIKEVGL